MFQSKSRQCAGPPHWTTLADSWGWSQFRGRCHVDCLSRSGFAPRLSERWCDKALPCVPFHAMESPEGHSHCPCASWHWYWFSPMDCAATGWPSHPNHLGMSQMGALGNLLYCRNWSSSLETWRRMYFQRCVILFRCVDKTEFLCRLPTPWNFWVLMTNPAEGGHTGSFFNLSVLRFNPRVQSWLIPCPPLRNLKTCSTSPSTMARWMFMFSWMDNSPGKTCM